MQSEASMKQTFMESNIEETMRLWSSVDAQISLDQLQRTFGKNVGSSEDLAMLLGQMERGELMKTLQNFTCDQEIVSLASKKGSSSVINNPQEQDYQTNKAIQQSPFKGSKMSSLEKEFVPSHRTVHFEQRSSPAQQQQDQSVAQQQPNFKPEISQPSMGHQSPILVLHENINKRVSQLIQSGCFENTEDLQWQEGNPFDAQDRKLELLRVHIRKTIERVEKLGIKNEQLEKNGGTIWRLHSWLKKLDLEYQAYQRYLEFVKHGKKPYQTFCYRDDSNPHNMTCYLCALKAFQLKNKELQTEELISKWIGLSNAETEECIFEGQKLKCDLEAKYKTIQLERLKLSSPHLYGVQHTALTQSLLSKSQNQMIFDLEKVLEVIDLA